MKDLNKLDSELTQTIKHFKSTNISSNAATNAPIDKQNLENLKNETIKALTCFKNAIIEFLSE